ncbi:MAG TPA: hypothetical protein P5234_01340 [Thermoanaerobaculaceae bacterium]|nr:hypothetical protein [Thermoanaerobaculaceae bacterium]HRS14870.1 hypothetical protein [Thermoanaerobaculaceae bacterium]
MRAFTLMTAVFVLVAAIGPAAAEQMPAPGETSSEVPALYAMHEVIHPLWHEAWPNKDLASMRELLPQVEQHVAAVQKAVLPGILRDKQESWTKGVEALAAAAAAMKTALAASDEKGSLDAVEELHARFEGLVRLIRPAMKELDAYHVVLYELYHKALPGKDAARIDTLADGLAARCAELRAAELPKRHAAKEAALRPAFASLCAATAELQALTAETPLAALEKAVEKVHTQYQAVEALFE